MPLGREDKEALNKAVLKIIQLISELESIPVDPRALDLLEIAGSLFEQQVELDIIFEEVNNNNNVVLIEDKQQLENIPSPEDLDDWFNMEDQNEIDKGT